MSSCGASTKKDRNPKKKKGGRPSASPWPVIKIQAEKIPLAILPAEVGLFGDLTSRRPTSWTTPLRCCDGHGFLLPY